MDKNNISFSIFLPVRNGGKYLPLCVESILAQSYKLFELVILENYSTDGSAEWLHELVQQDSRIKIVPSDKPLSIEKNWQRILALPKNEFLTIVGHDDLLDPDYLLIMSNLIIQNPTAGLYHTHFRLIDSDGAVIRNCLPMPAQQTDAEFLKDILTFKIDSYGTGYVMRSENYEKVGGMPDLHNLMFADHALWITLLQGSWKATGQQECIAYRIHEISTSALTSGIDYLIGLEQFVDFLSEIRKNDSTISHACRKNLKKYIFSIHKKIYLRYLYEASQQNIILESNVKDSILLSLERLQPELKHIFNKSILINTIELLNKSRWRKMFSTVYRSRCRIIVGKIWRFFKSFATTLQRFQNPLPTKPME